MRSLRVFLSLLVLGGLIPSLAAQPAADGNLAKHFLVDVKDGKAAEFEAAFKAHLQWRKEQGDTWEWLTFQLVNGEYLGDYVVRSGSHTWADMDAYQDFLDKGAVHFWTSVGAYIDDVNSYIMQVDNSISRWPTDPGSARYLTVIDYWVKPTHTQVFLRTVKEIHEAIGTSGWPVHYAWEATLNGGPGGNWALVLPYPNYAAMKGPDKTMMQMLTEVHGEGRTGEIMSSFAGTYERSESHIIRFRPDLSLMP